MDEIDAGLGEADGGELDAAAPEGAEAEGGTDGVGPDDGLRAEGGVFVNDEVLECEAGERKEIEADFVEVDGAAEAVADAGGDAALVAVAVDADVWGKQDQQKQSEGRERQIEESTERVDADDRGGVCSRGISLLVGGICFLHEHCPAWWGLAMPE